MPSKKLSELGYWPRLSQNDIGMNFSLGLHRKLLYKWGVKHSKTTVPAVPRPLILNVFEVTHEFSVPEVVGSFACGGA